MSKQILRYAGAVTALVLVLLVVRELVAQEYSGLRDLLRFEQPLLGSSFDHSDQDQVIVDVRLGTGSSFGNTGDWQRVGKDIYLGRRWLHRAYIYMRTKPQAELTDDDLIVWDVVPVSSKGIPEHIIKTLEPDSVESLKTDSTAQGRLKILKMHGWQAVDELWVQYGKYGPKGQRALSGLDVLFGEGAVEVRRGWNLKPGYLYDDTDIRPQLTLRQVHTSKPPTREPLKVNQDGTLKILQLADMHLSTLNGVCRDPWPPETGEGCEADPRTLHFIEQLLAQERPDFVVFTGDQIMGGTAGPDALTSILKAVEPLERLHIPYAMVWGNHDDESTLTRKQLTELVQDLPHSYMKMGPEDVSGFGNYLVEIKAAAGQPNTDDSDDYPTAVTLSFLDSHKYHDYAGGGGYDWVKDDQIEFLRAEFERTAKSRQAFEDTNGVAGLKLHFQHIPLTEYRNNDQPFVGQYVEACTAPLYNNGLRAVLADELGVHLTTAGHDHCNDFCMWDESDNRAIWMCHGGGIGEGGYGGYGGFIRRARVFALDTTKGQIATYKIREDDLATAFDHQVLVVGSVTTKE